MLAYPVKMLWREEQRAKKYELLLAKLCFS